MKGSECPTEENPVEKSTKRKSLHKSPLVGLFVCLTLFVGAVYLHLHPEVLDRLFSEFNLSPVSEIGVKEREKRMRVKGAKSILTEKSEKKGLTASWNLKGVNYLIQWGDRKKELDNREVELTKRETELQEQRKRIEARIRYLDGVRSKVASMLKKKVIMDEGRVQKLVDFYSNMNPQNAAKIINSINEDLAIVILGQMKKFSAAEIMNRLEPEKAQKLSEKFAGY